ncbi:hypothetical protein AB836_01700 [Rickettsiales bacterium (ex Bugula neritina AB1)]|nr:hypothetical protein AB836_01700 [Rickettsiales bacterium (ex Bugula neritina AB1)]
MENAILPSYATEGSAGLDLFSLQDITISSNSFGEVSTGVKLFLPHNRIIAEIRSRSSLGKKGLIILTNHFDFQDNGQEVIVKFFNLSKEDIVIKTNERIAQIVFNSLLRPEIEIRDMLDKTVRNQGGFGSTGK